MYVNVYGFLWACWGTLTHKETTQKEKTRSDKGKTEKDKYTRGETTVADGPSSSAVAGGQASSAVAGGGYIVGFFAPDGRWIAHGRASGVHPTKGSGEAQYKRLPPRPALKSEAADESAEPPTHNPFIVDIRVNEEECLDDSGDGTVKEEEHSADESGQTPANAAAAVADEEQPSSVPPSFGDDEDDNVTDEAASFYSPSKTRDSHFSKPFLDTWGGPDQ